MADTFRADNLTADRASGLTPRIDAFAGRALRFTRAWSTSSWTLPAHGSMFSGLYPFQHGAINTMTSLSEDVETIAERLRAAGWRTGAITDAGYVSARHGLDQGFEFFRERWGELDETLDAARAFLDADDGRPVFLFVQTYRVHAPYVVPGEAGDDLHRRLGIARDFDAIEGELERKGWDWRKDRAVPDGMDSVVEELERLYLGGVRDLDRGFGELLDDLEARGMGAAWTIFTSDHGEAFGEHDTWGHGWEVYEESLRVPLLIVGPGVAPAESDLSASILDLPTTIAEMAGVSPDPTWLGTSLLSLSQERPLLGFSGGASSRPAAALIEGGRKILLPLEKDALGAGVLEGFDLEADPDERSPVAPDGWPGELRERRATLLEVMMRPVVGPGAARVTDDEAASLEDLGYGGAREELEAAEGER